MRKDLAYYAKKFSKLNVNRHQEREAALRKPVLLISMIELIEHGKIQFIQVKLLLKLISTFLKYWHTLIMYGLALCRNHHWAFGHAWFEVHDDYQILISQGRFMEEPAMERRKMMAFQEEAIGLSKQ